MLHYFIVHQSPLESRQIYLQTWQQRKYRNSKVSSHCFAFIVSQYDVFTTSLPVFCFKRHISINLLMLPQEQPSLKRLAVQSSCWFKPFCVLYAIQCLYTCTHSAYSLILCHNSFFASDSCLHFSEYFY